MSVQSVLASGRRAALLRMTSTATFRRKTGATAQNETTGEVGDVWETTHTDLPGRLDAGHGHAGRVRAVDVAGVQIVAPDPEWHAPWGTTNVREGDYIDVTAGDSAPVVLRVREVPVGDQQTALRLPVEVVDRPSEWGA